MSRPVPEKAPSWTAPAWLFRSCVWLALLAYLGVAAFNIAFGAMNVDEGFYAVAARAVWEGEVPYRDFGFTQTPWVLYANGLVMGLTRFGLFEQRIVNGCWGLLALLLGARLLWRRGAAWHAVLLLALFALSPAWMYLVNFGKTYGFVSLVAMAAVTVWLDWPAGGKKSAALSLLAVVGVGCRLPAAPFFGVLWLVALWDDGGFDRRRVGIAVGCVAAGAAGLLLPFYLLAPDQTRFWVVDFHRVSVPLRDWRVRWEEIFALAPAVWGLLVFALVAAVGGRRRWPWRESGVVIAALVALGGNLLPKGAYEEYGVPFLPPLAVAVLLLLPPGVAAWRASYRCLSGLVLVAGPLLLIPVLCGDYRGRHKQSFPSILLPLNTPPYNYELPTNIRHSRDLVAQALPAGEPFYGPAIILAVEADRPVPRRLRMGAFTMTSDFSEAEADRLHLMTYPEMTRVISGSDVRVFGLHAQPLFNYAWSVPSFGFQPDEERVRFGEVFERRFRTVRTDTDFSIMVSRH